MVSFDSKSHFRLFRRVSMKTGAITSCTHKTWIWWVHEIFLKWVSIFGTWGWTKSSLSLIGGVSLYLVGQLYLSQNSLSVVCPLCLGVELRLSSLSLNGGVFLYAFVVISIPISFSTHIHSFNTFPSTISIKHSLFHTLSPKNEYLNLSNRSHIIDDRESMSH